GRDDGAEDGARLHLLLRVLRLLLARLLRQGDVAGGLRALLVKANGGPLVFQGDPRSLGDRVSAMGTWLGPSGGRHLGAEARTPVRGFRGPERYPRSGERDANPSPFLIQWVAHGDDWPEGGTHEPPQRAGRCWSRHREPAPGPGRARLQARGDADGDEPGQEHEARERRGIKEG